MSRSGTQKQDQTYSKSNQVGDLAQANQSSLGSTLSGMYTGEATAPPGYGDATKALINTAGQQSVGGADSAVKGASGLRAMRSGNRGGFQTTLDESVRNAMRQNSQNSLGTEVQDAQLKELQKQSGISGLQGLYGSNVQELLGSMGISSGIANNQASQPGWFQNMTGLIGSLAGAGAKGVTL